MNLCGIEHITKHNFDLSSVSSMKTGGCAAYAFFPTDESELETVLCATNDVVHRHIIGNASNVLFPDRAENLNVIFTVGMKKIAKISDTRIYAECGALLTSVSVFAKNSSLSGLEFAYGIPGTVGGGVFMNAGAYGGELSQVLYSVRVLDTAKNEFYEIHAGECGFSYRRSIFMDKREIVIVGAYFELKKGDASEIEELCKKNMQSRREKQPLEYPSCGSAFKRPEGHFAGKLIEDAGLKGISVGGAAVSEKHAGFIINRGGATSDDVKELISVVKTKVLEKYGVELHPEIEVID